MVFKPKWYDNNYVVEGPVYAGKDRYTSEILAFYLSGILNKPLVPISTYRSINLHKEILPVASEQLLETAFILNGSTCVYGKCYYCKKTDPICEGKDGHWEGVVIFNVKLNMKSYRSPWQRTYKKNKLAVWETDNNYCRYSRLSRAFE